MTAADVTRFTHSRSAVSIAAFLAAGAALLWYVRGYMPDPPVSEGLVSGWGGCWQLPSAAGVCVSIALSLSVAWLAGYINKIFNLLRALTKLQSSFFLLMQAATPALLLYPCRGDVLCLLAMVCMLLMMSVYANPQAASHRVFLVFALLSLYLSVDVCAIFYVPVFLLSMVQLRVFSGPTMVAALLGIVTPWVILLGFGVVGLDGLQFPVPVFNPFANTAQLPVSVLVTAGFTAFVAVTAWVQNIFKVLTYNAQSRSYLGVLSVVTLVTVVAAVLDFPDIYSFLPLLNCCAAMQLAHLFGAVYHQQKSFIAVFAVSLIYIALYVCQTLFLLL